MTRTIRVAASPRRLAQQYPAVPAVDQVGGDRIPVRYRVDRPSHAHAVAVVTGLLALVGLALAAVVPW